MTASNASKAIASKTRKAPRRKEISEHAHQCNTCEWFWLQYPALRKHLFAIPNGGDRHPVVAAKLKAEGVLRGVSDLFLMVPRGTFHGMFIEMKSRTGSLTDEQGEFIERAAAQGYATAVCHSFDEARDVITRYL
ncbi:MAG: VRR-NUC domain-containing protein [bacterium]|nr:VRR-NUC domain-containing protein [bacterium]